MGMRDAFLMKTNGIECENITLCEEDYEEYK